MNATEAYRAVYEAAIKHHKRGGQKSRALDRALRIVVIRITRMERRLAHIRAKRKTSINRPACLR